jgi:repressor LexA
MSLTSKIKELAKSSDLSKRQIDVLLCIKGSIERYQIPPTYREIGNELEINSTNAISDHVKALKKKGYLLDNKRNNNASKNIGSNSSGKARGLVLTNKAKSFLRNHFDYSDFSLSDNIQISTSKQISNNHNASHLSGMEQSEEEQQNYFNQYQQLQDIIQVPIIGQVAAGNPIFASEEYDDSVHVDSSMTSGSRNVFALRVKGDSMIEEGIHDGDIVIVRKQNTANEGNIVVALIEDEATVKFYFREKNRIRLQPANSMMNPIYLTPAQEACIQGVVTSVFRRYNP